MDKKTEKNSVSVAPPNRLPGNTLQLKENALIDWVQVTFLPNEKMLTEFDILSRLFNLKNDDWIFENYGRYLYKSRFTYKNIKLYSGGNIGFHLEMSGEACRDFEEMGLNWLDFFKTCFYLNGRFTRIDIAIDMFEKKYFDLNTIRNKYIKHEFKSKLKVLNNFEQYNCSDMYKLGDSITFGQRSSDIVIQFYDKLKERDSNNYILPPTLKFWNRVEIRLRHEHANSFMLLYCGIDNKHDIGYYAKSVLSNYLNFINKTNDTNKARWPVSKFWKNFLGNVEHLKLSKQDVELSITNKRKWITEFTSRTQFEVFVSGLEHFDIDKMTQFYIYDILLSGFEKCESSNRFDLKVINDYRIKKGYNPLTNSDLKKIASDIRDRYFIEELKEQTY